MRFATCLLLTGSLLYSVTGCYTWTRQPIPASDPPAFRQFQIWTPDSSVMLQNVRIEDDSLYGTPIGVSRDCISCAVSLPMNRVDSLRTGNTEHVGTALLGVGAGAAAVIIYLGYLFSQSAD